MSPEMQNIVSFLIPAYVVFWLFTFLYVFSVRSRQKNLEKDIDQQINEIISFGHDVLENETQIDLLISLAHCSLTLQELSELMVFQGIFRFMPASDKI